VYSGHESGMRSNRIVSIIFLALFSVFASSLMFFDIFWSGGDSWLWV